MVAKRLMYEDDGVKKENWKLLQYILLTLPFLDSTFTNSIPVLERINLVCKVVATVIILWLYVTRTKPFSKIDVLVICFELYIVAVTFVQGADVRRAVMTVMPVIAVTLLYEIGLDDASLFIKSQYLCFSLLVYSNLISELLYPEGMFIAPLTGFTQNWILGYYNNHTLFFIMAICMALLYGRIWNKELGPSLLIIAIGISALLVRSGGVLAALAGAAIGIVVLILNRRSIRYSICWALPLVFAGLILLQNSTAFIDVIWTISQDLFEKGGSFTARLDLWQRAVDYIYQSPIIGHGIESQQQRLFEYAWGLHAHNLVLELLHQGGVVGLALFSSIVGMAGLKLGQVKENRLYMCLTVAFFAWAIHSCVEPFMSSFLMALFIVAYRLPEIESNLACSDNRIDIPISFEKRFTGRRHHKKLVAYVKR